MYKYVHVGMHIFMYILCIYVYNVCMYTMYVCVLGVVVIRISQHIAFIRFGRYTIYTIPECGRPRILK